MHVKSKIAVVTGGASGIGAALARRFHAEGAKANCPVSKALAGVQIRLEARLVGATAGTGR